MKLLLIYDWLTQVFDALMHCGIASKIEHVLFFDACMHENACMHDACMHASCMHSHKHDLNGTSRL